jgi:anti-anti-sigma regulatory factor
MAIKYNNQINDYLVLSIEGVFTIWDVNVLEEAFSTIAENNALYIAVDFSKTETVHTAIIGPLLKLKRTIAPLGGRIVLCAFPPDLRFIMTIIKSDCEFTFLASIQALKEQEAKPATAHFDSANIAPSKPVIYDLNDEE